MVTESLLFIWRRRYGPNVTRRRPGARMWIHALPLKMRFNRSKIYVSVIPVCAIGYIMGALGAILGFGGGFLLVPMLIYVLRVPTATVIGTSNVLTMATMVVATISHAATNHLVDGVLALILMIGGVSGAQFGARAAQRIPAERLRFLLGLRSWPSALDSPLRFWRGRKTCTRSDLPVSPSHEGAPLSVDRSHACRLPGGGGRPREQLVLTPSTTTVFIRSNYIGTSVALFGAVQGVSELAKNAADYDVVITIIGPRQTLVARRKSRVFGIWANADSRTFTDVPSYLEVLANRKLASIAPPAESSRNRIGLEYMLPASSEESDAPFRAALVQIESKRGVFAEKMNASTFFSSTLFRAEIVLPANVQVGTYTIDVKLFSNGNSLRKRRRPSRSSRPASYSSLPTPRRTMASSTASL